MTLNALFEAAGWSKYSGNRNLVAYNHGEHRVFFTTRAAIDVRGLGIEQAQTHGLQVVLGGGTKLRLVATTQNVAKYLALVADGSISFVGSQGASQGVSGPPTEAELEEARQLLMAASK